MPSVLPTVSLDAKSGALLNDNNGLMASKINIESVTVLNLNSTKCGVDQAFSEMGLHPGQMTDPQVMITILADMQLQDFTTEYEPAHDFLNRLIHDRIAIDPYREAVRQILNDQYPAIEEFLALAQARHWLSDLPVVSWSLHVGILLETLTSGMSASAAFSKDLQTHITAKRREHGLTTTRESLLKTFWRSWHITGRFFLATKVVSIDPALSYFMFKRHQRVPSPKQLRRLLDQGKISLVEYKSHRPVTAGHMNRYHEGLRLNVMEAGVTEYLAGYEDNALCAHVLMLELQRHPLLQGADGQANCNPCPVNGSVSMNRGMPPFSLAMSVICPWYYQRCLFQACWARTLHIISR